MKQEAQATDYALPPIVHPDVYRFLQTRSSDLFRLMELNGSPVQLVFPHIMLETARHFRRVLDAQTAHGGQVYFAAKANKANAFLAASPLAGIGADVSSAQEFTAALGAGVRGENMSVSGPAKQPGLHTLAILHGARISVDEPEELASVIELAKRLPTNHRVRILLRLSASDTSRFGLTEQEADEALTSLMRIKSDLLLEGFSFHVSGYSSAPREAMIGSACRAMQRANAAGLSPTHINIGGGFRAAYAHPGSWSLKKATEREFAGGERPQFVYPYATQPSGHEQLAAILHSSRPDFEKAAATAGRPLKIDVEPGRSLLDQAGITVFRVHSVRGIGDRSLVLVDGSSRNLAEFWRNSEFFTDPFIIASSPRPAEPFSAAIASNTCLESDYLARRFVPFHTRPQPGDLLVYVNTAGYQMDSKESDFHRAPLPGKVVAIPAREGWRFINDQIISAADLISADAKNVQT